MYSSVAFLKNLIDGYPQFSSAPQPHIFSFPLCFFNTKNYNKQDRFPVLLVKTFQENNFIEYSSKESQNNLCCWFFFRLYKRFSGRGCMPLLQLKKKFCTKSVGRFMIWRIQNFMYPSRVVHQLWVSVQKLNTYLMWSSQCSYKFFKKKCLKIWMPFAGLL